MLTAWPGIGAKATSAASLQAYALHLRPGDDLRQQLQAFVQAHQLKAGAVLTCVGSLTDE